ncbi:MAG TPA: DUF2085 domain-containing protein [Ktedonobacterales bacterium]
MALNDTPKGPQTPEEIQAALTGISVRRQRYSRLVSRVVDWLLTPFQHHWLAVLNTALALFIGVSALAPLGYAIGLSGPSSAVFRFYRIFCGQVPSHSFYIAGYQMCLCSRCLAIYSSLLAAGLILTMFRYRPELIPRPIGWKLWMLGMLPMALDGGFQLVGWHESNVYLRLLTGVIFGLATAWFVLPQIEDASDVSTVRQRAAAAR